MLHSEPIKLHGKLNVANEGMNHEEVTAEFETGSATLGENGDTSPIYRLPKEDARESKDWCREDQLKELKGRLVFTLRLQ